MRPLNARSKHDLRLSAAHVAAGAPPSASATAPRSTIAKIAVPTVSDHAPMSASTSSTNGGGTSPKQAAEGDLVQRGASARAEHTADAERDARRRARRGAARLPRLRDEGDAAGGEEHGEHRQQREPAAEERHREQRDQRRRHAE